MRKHAVPTLIAIAALAVVFVVGFSLGKAKNETYFPPEYITDGELPTALEDEKINFALFWKAWRLLDERFVSTKTDEEEVSSEEKLWFSIKGLAASYADPYTVFLTPDENSQFQNSISGSFSGIGIEIGMKDGFITVIAPLKGTPADRAGLKTGDIIVGIDEESTQGFFIDEAVSLIQGKKGTPVILSILREGEGEPLEIRIVRDTISIPTLDTSLRSDGVYVIELYNFSAPSANLFRSAIRDFVASGSNKLILDLRGNAGGLLDSAINISSWFLSKGTIVVTEDHGSGMRVDHVSEGYVGIDEDTEIVVLVDGGSASAAEIVAGALQSADIATLVGATTFGKGSVQELVPLTGKTSLKITVARWLTPDGISISDGGLTPDIEILFTPEDVEEGIDIQLEKALEILLGPIAN